MTNFLKFLHFFSNKYVEVVMIDKHRLYPGDHNENLYFEVIMK